MISLYDLMLIPTLMVILTIINYHYRALPLGPISLSQTYPQTRNCSHFVVHFYDEKPPLLTRAFELIPIYFYFPTAAKQNPTNAPSSRGHVATHPLTTHPRGQHIAPIHTGVLWPHFFVYCFFFLLLLHRQSWRC